MFCSHQPAFQAVLLIIVFQVSLLIQNKFKPYFKPEINSLEQITLVSSNFVLLAGLVAHVGEFTSEAYKVIISFIIIATICISSLIMFGSIIYNFTKSVIEANRRRLQKFTTSIAALGGKRRASNQGKSLLVTKTVRVI